MSNDMSEILVCCYRPWDISSNKSNVIACDSYSISNLASLKARYDKMNLNMSNGEVIELNILEKHNFVKGGLFSNSIFGFDYKWECDSCGNIESPFQICQKCGWDIFWIYSDSDFYGHISLAKEVKISSRGYIDTIYVIPTKFRRLQCKISKKKPALDICEITVWYRKIIVRNNRLKRLLSLKAPEIIIVNEIKLLTKAVERFFNAIVAFS